MGVGKSVVFKEKPTETVLNALNVDQKVLLGNLF